jgi:hypothetical protein
MSNPEPKPIGWLPLSLGGWILHLLIGSGVFAHLFVTAPAQVSLFQEYNLALPALSKFVFDITHIASASSAYVFFILGGLALFDGAMLVALAMSYRSLWKSWFWGVLIVLLLAMLLFELALTLPEWKLREALAR